MKGLKRTLGFTTLLVASLVQGQDTIHVYKNGNITFKKSCSDIDSMNFNKLGVKFAKNDTLFFYKKGLITNSQAITSMDSVMFRKGKGRTGYITESTPISDASGNTYPTITIGTQTWMQENLRTEKYSDGTLIPLITNTSAPNTPAMFWYNNDKATHTANKNGALYNWYAVSPLTNEGKNVCPIGWHVSNDIDWITLANYLIANGYNYDGSTKDNKIAKALASMTSWPSNGSILGSIYTDLSKNNSSNFYGLPSGFRDSQGNYTSIGIIVMWMNASGDITLKKPDRYMGRTHNSLNNNASKHNQGNSVRCVKD